MAAVSGVKKLQEILKGAAAPRVLAVVAPDRIRLERIAKLYCDTFIMPPSSESPGERGLLNLKLKRFDCRGYTTAQVARIREELRARSIFSKVQFFWIDRLESLDAKLSRELADIVAHAPRDVTILLTAQEIKESHPCLKSLPEGESLVMLPQLKGIDLKRWVVREFTQLGVVSVAENLVEAVITMGKGDPDVLAPMIERLVTYADDRAPSVADVGRLFVAETELSEFRLLDSVVHQNPALAHVVLRELLSDGKNPFLLLSMLSRTAVQYFLINFCLKEGAAAPLVRERLEINPWVFSRQVDVAKRLDSRRAAELLGENVWADSKMKNRSLGTTEILDCFVAALRDNLAQRGGISARR